MVKIINDRLSNNTLEFWDSYYKEFDTTDIQLSRLKLYNDIKDFLCLDNFSLLEIGCGSGYGINHLFSFFPDARLEGNDLSKIAIQKAQRDYPNIEFNQLDILKESISNKYDYILIIETLEHLYKPNEIIKKCLSQCKFLIISVPYKKEMNKSKCHVVLNFDESFFCKYNMIKHNIVKHNYKKGKTRTFLQVLLKGEL